MPRTEVRGGQVKDSSIGRSDLVIATAGEAVVAKIVAGAGITLSATGADTGTGDVTVSVAATVPLLASANVFSATQTVTKNALAGTSTDGIVLQNTTGAAAGVQQWSPRFRLTGQGWKTTGGASVTVDWIVELQPVQGAANPTANLVLSSQLAAGGYIAAVSVLNTGILVLPNNGGGIALDGTNVPNLVATGGYAQLKAVNGGNGCGFGLSGAGGNPEMLLAAPSGVGRITIGSTYNLSWGSSGTATPDLMYWRDAAASSAQRNAAIAQRHRLYNIFTTLLTSGEWWKEDWITTPNQFRFGTVKGTVTGTARLASWDYGGTESSPVAAITVPITLGNILFGGGIDVPGNAVIRTVGATLADVPLRPLTLAGSDSATSDIVIGAYSNVTGHASCIHFSDAFTYNLCVGTDSVGNFSVWAGRYPGVAGTVVFTVTQAGRFNVYGSGLLGKYVTSTARGSGAAYFQIQDPTGIKGYLGYTGATDQFELYNALNAPMVFSTNGLSAITISVTAGVRIHGVLSVGTNYATSGAINLPNATYIMARNAPNSADRVLIGMNTSDRIVIGSSGIQDIEFAGDVLVDGHLRFGTDATYDIGASGGLRPRDGFFSRHLTIGSILTVGVNVWHLGADGYQRFLFTDGPTYFKCASNTGLLYEFRGYSDGVFLQILSTGLRFPMNVAGAPTFASGDKYLVVDASGNVHVSAVGPAS